MADKLIHFIFYFGFVFLWYQYMYFKRKVGWNDKMLLGLIAAVIGILIELGQGYFTVNRQADVFDALANTIGAISGIVTASLLLRKYYSIE